MASLDASWLARDSPRLCDWTRRFRQMDVCASRCGHSLMSDTRCRHRDHRRGRRVTERESERERVRLPLYFEDTRYAGDSDLHRLASWTLFIQASCWDTRTISPCVCVCAFLSTLASPCCLLVDVNTSSRCVEATRQDFPPLSSRLPLFLWHTTEILPHPEDLLPQALLLHHLLLPLLRLLLPFLLLLLPFSHIFLRSVTPHRDVKRKSPFFFFVYIEGPMNEMCNANVTFQSPA